MNRILFVVGNDVFLNQKNMQESVNIGTPTSFSGQDSFQVPFSVSSVVIENILSIYRIVFDLKEPTDNVFIGTCFGDSKTCYSMIHAWKKEEQSMTYILQRFAKMNLNIMKKIRLCSVKDWKNYDDLLDTLVGKQMIAPPKLLYGGGGGETEDDDPEFQLNSSDEEDDPMNNDSFLGFLELEIEEKKIDFNQVGDQVTVQPPPPTEKTKKEDEQSLKVTIIPPPPRLPSSSKMEETEETTKESNNKKKTRRRQQQQQQQQQKVKYEHTMEELNNIWFVDFFSKILKRLYYGKPTNRSISDAKIVYFTTEDKITHEMVQSFFYKKGLRNIVINNKCLNFDFDIFVLLNSPPPPNNNNNTTKRRRFQRSRIPGVVEETILLPHEFTTHPIKCRVRKYYIYPYQTKLSDCLLNEICLKMRYVKVIMKDIPFAPQSSSSSGHHHKREEKVLKSSLCKFPFVVRGDSRVDLTLSLPQMDNEASHPLLLYYLPTNSMTIHNQLTTRSVHPISPQYINSFVGEFIRYFIEQRVSMVFSKIQNQKNGNVINNNNKNQQQQQQQKQQQLPSHSTHFIQGHHGRLYLHTVLPASHFSFPPRLVPSPSNINNKPIYRKEEMNKLIERYNHTTKKSKKNNKERRTNLKINTPRFIFDDEEEEEVEEEVEEGVEEESEEKEEEEEESVFSQQQQFRSRTHRHQKKQVYETYKYLEDVGRVNPITHQSHSILFRADGAFSTLLGHLEPVIRQIRMYGKKVTTSMKSQSKKILKHLREEMKENKSEFYFPEYSELHTLRFHAYQRIWYELRELAVLYRKPEYAMLMNRIHPSFFFITDTKRKEQEKIKKFIRIERDVVGKPILPFQIGSAVQIECLGTVIYDRESYYTDKYIWPVGFRSTRVYFDINNVDERIKYICEIKDGGNAPLFQISTGRKGDPVIMERSCTAVWTVIVKQVNAAKTHRKQQRVFTNVSGPEYFGLSHPQVIQLISELPNAEKIRRPNCPFQPTSIISHYSNNIPLESQFFSSSSSHTPTTTENRQQQQQLEQKQQENQQLLVFQNLPLPKRLKKERDLRIEKERISNTEKKKKVTWTKNTSLYQHFQKLNDMNGSAVEFSGREEGRDGLYSEKPIILIGGKKSNNNNNDDDDDDDNDCYFDENGDLVWKKKKKKKKNNNKKKRRRRRKKNSSSLVGSSEKKKNNKRKREETESDLDFETESDEKAKKKRKVT